MWRASSRIAPTQTDTAYQAWRDWEQQSLDGPLSIVRAGILAASARNAQPWLFRIGPDRITVHADMSHHLGALDPYAREMHLSIGCALANMEIAARAAGFEPMIGYRDGMLHPVDPAGMPPQPTLDTASAAEAAATVLATTAQHHVATLYLTPVDAASAAAGRNDPLFDAIRHRHTNRGPYDPTRTVPDIVQEALRMEDSERPPVKIMLLGPGNGSQAVAPLIAASAEAVFADPAMLRETLRWLRPDERAIQSQPDGILQSGELADSDSGLLAGMLNPPDANEMPTRMLAEIRNTQLATATTFGVIAVRDRYMKPQTVAAGRAWQRIHLRLVAEGLAAQPVNHPTRIVDRDRALGAESPMEAALASAIGDGAWQPTLIFRAGVAASEAVASPRRDLTSVLLG